MTSIELRQQLIRIRQEIQKRERFLRGIDRKDHVADEAAEFSRNPISPTSKRRRIHHDEGEIKEKDGEIEQGRKKRSIASRLEIPANSEIELNSASRGELDEAAKTREKNANRDQEPDQDTEVERKETQRRKRGRGFAGGGSNRLFGALLMGTLNKFNRDSEKKSEAERLQEEKLKKAEETAAAMAEIDVEEEKRLLKEAREKEMKLKEELDTVYDKIKEEESLRLTDKWLAHRMTLSVFLKTEAEPSVFYMPAVHNSKTANLLRHRIDAEQEAMLEGLSGNGEGAQAQAEDEAQDEAEGNKEDQDLTAAVVDVEAAGSDATKDDEGKPSPPSPSPQGD